MDQRFHVVALPGKGRGVIANVAFGVGELVEVAHCILIPNEQCAAASQTVLCEYTYSTGAGQLVALNHGSLFNHSRSPNLSYEKDVEQLVIRYYASRPIAIGDELTIFYGHKVWFDDDPDKLYDTAAASDDEHKTLVPLLGGGDGDDGDADRAALLEIFH
jgi:hypothetical protein